ncbi:expressed unknown protein [Seminavis robusta]|uniref:Uncharacterized protein n=1 Tax=Seminavis robusta TaxID=568900 RepID=A0A9N8HB13_9STRA|nr:expressed unknown protein [Seminavis robusta]|eukprot:Sro167_g074350.1 n/a (373) ;mRNA; f:15072-16190
MPSLSEREFFIVIHALAATVSVSEQRSFRRNLVWFLPVSSCSCLSLVVLRLDSISDGPQECVNKTRVFEKEKCLSCGTKIRFCTAADVTEYKPKPEINPNHNIQQKTKIWAERMYTGTYPQKNGERVPFPISRMVVRFRDDLNQLVFESNFLHRQLMRELRRKDRVSATQLAKQKANFENIFNERKRSFEQGIRSRDEEIHGLRSANAKLAEELKEQRELAADLRNRLYGPTSNKSGRTGRGPTSSQRSTFDPSAAFHSSDSITREFDQGIPIDDTASLQESFGSHVGHGGSFNRQAMANSSSASYQGYPPTGTGERRLNKRRAVSVNGGGQRPIPAHHRSSPLGASGNYGYQDAARPASYQHGYGGGGGGY